MEILSRPFRIVPADGNVNQKQFRDEFSVAAVGNYGWRVIERLIEKIVTDRMESE